MNNSIKDLSGIEPFEKKIYLSSPTMHGEELEYVKEAFDTNWLSTVGMNINEAERIAAQYTGCGYAVALSCGTAALHMATRLAGERLYGQAPPNKGALQGKKVFCSDVTFDASVNPVAYEDGEAVFIDTEYDTWNMDPAALEKAFSIYPEVKLVGNAKTFTMMKQFFTFDVDQHSLVVKEGETLQTGRHTFSFAMIPMVHWPECMVTYDAADKILFSADAFGTFGALSGNIFADEVDFEKEWLGEARRYLVNIVGKYGTQILAALKKAAALDIQMICPLHGPIWRENLGWLIDKYQTWANYQPEDHAVLILYASIYGNTESAVNALAGKLADAGERKIAMYDVSVTDPSYLLSEVFCCDRIVFACPTYNAGIFPKMETLLSELAAHNFQKRKLAILENGTWAISSGKLMREILSGLKGMEIMESTLTVKSSLKEEQLTALDEIVSFLRQ